MPGRRRPITSICSSRSREFARRSTKRRRRRGRRREASAECGVAECGVRHVSDASIAPASICRSPSSRWRLTSQPRSTRRRQSTSSAAARSADRAAASRSRSKSPQATPRIFSFTFPEAARASAMPAVSPSPPRPLAPSLRRRAPNQAAHPHQAARRHHQARRPAVLRPAAAAGNADPVGRAALSRSSRFRISIRASRFCIRATRRSWPTRWAWARRCRRSRRCACCLRSGEIRSVLLVCPKPLVTNWQREFTHVGARDSADDHRRGLRPSGRWQWTQADAPVKIANYELLMRDRDVLDERPALRPGRARRGPADQEHRQHDEPDRPLDPPHAQLGPHRHADRKHARRPGRHLRVPLARLPASAAWRRERLARAGPRPHPPPHEGHGADRPAAQAVSRRRARPLARAAGHATRWPRTKA